MNTAELQAVPGVTECRLPDSVVSSLPSSAAEAPWDVTCSSIIWYARGNAAAASAAGAAAQGARRAAAVSGGLVAYEDTPVGPYSEVFGTVAFRSGRSVHGTIPFMAVDSRDSLVGGRQNWSLPKCLASFTGSPAAGAMSAEGDGWTVRVSVRTFGPRFPMKMTGRLVQPWPDGVLRASMLRGKARARSALVTVEVRSAGTLASWLRPGRHLGAVLEGTRFELGESSPLPSRQ
jgi:hypothetical protein